MRTADDLRHEVDLILQQHPVVRLRGVEHPLDILARHAAVCAAEHDNPVLTGGVYLDNGMSGRAVHLAQQRGIRTGFPQQIGHKAAFRADRARVQHLCARSSRRQ